MPFDVDTVVRATRQVAAAEPSLVSASALSLAWALAGDPDPAWAAANPDRCLAFLFVSPRDCPAVDAVVAA